ncbi:MAG: Holliday junction resolvase RuvX [Candidatus Saccharibacteria bacterium]|nr:Holliday junction resolvase RuvX [Candidatus Saccharibacteria bacterium]
MAVKQIMALDYGDVRVGVALADAQVKIALPHTTLDNNEQLLTNILKITLENDIDLIVVGYPRNQSGEPTEQTHKVEAFVKKLREIYDGEINFKDESLTSVLAEERLKSYKKPYVKADIDAYAAAIILEDYLEGR